MKIKLDKNKEKLGKLVGRLQSDGTFSFGTYTQMKLNHYAKDNPNAPFEIRQIMPESNKQRGFFEGAICPLVAYYQEGMDYRNSENIREVREWLKVEFNGDFVTIGGKSNKVAQSTKNKLSDGFLERVIEYLIENYAPPYEALDPKKFRDWKDRIYPYGGPEDYLSYLKEINILK